MNTTKYSKQNFINILVVKLHAGFTHSLESCCGYGGKYGFEENSLCGSIITVNGTQVVVEPYEWPSEYINYEGVTYTEAADRITSGKISSGTFSYPPNSLKTACRKSWFPIIYDIKSNRLFPCGRQIYELLIEIFLNSYYCMCHVIYLVHFLFYAS